jgi:hypothetical protein
MDWNSRDSSLFENDLKARPEGLCKYAAGSNAVASFLRIGVCLGGPSNTCILTSLKGQYQI